MLDTLLERRELLHKLLESQVLEALVSSGMLSVLLADSTSTQVFRQMVTGHALETLIDTNVLPALLGAGSMERCHGAGCGDQQGLSIRSYSLTFIIHITVWELCKRAESRAAR